jgi:hypothetical protein
MSPHQKVRVYQLVSIRCNVKRLQAELESYELFIAQLIDDSGWRSSGNILLNSIERLAKENMELLNGKQKLQDVVNILKGEKGRPTIKAGKKQSGDISSDTERKRAELAAKKSVESCDGETPADTENKKTRQRESKLINVIIDREEICPLDKTGLPDDLVFKGYEEVVIQELIIRTDNVKYRRESFYSPSTGKSYLGELPEYFPMCSIDRNGCNWSDSLSL